MAIEWDPRNRRWVDYSGMTPPDRLRSLPPPPNPGATGIQWDPRYQRYEDRNWQNDRRRLDELPPPPGSPAAQNQGRQAPTPDMTPTPPGASLADAMRREIEMPGEEEYYNRQIGAMNRLFGARQQVAQTGLANAMLSRGRGQSGYMSTGMANIARQFGDQFASGVNNLNDERFTARESRFQRSLDRQFDREQAEKNYQYQMGLLKEQQKAGSGESWLSSLGALGQAYTQYRYGRGDSTNSGRPTNPGTSQQDDEDY